MKDKYTLYPWSYPNLQECDAIPIGPEKEMNIIRDFVRDICWRPLNKYFKVLKWAPHDPEKPGVTFMEMVVDFELTSGLNLTDPRFGSNTTWKQKEFRIKKLFRWFCKTHPEYNAPAKSMVMPHVTMFGGHHHQGLDRRFCFLGKAATEEIFVKT